MGGPDEDFQSTVDTCRSTERILVSDVYKGGLHANSLFSSQCGIDKFDSAYSGFHSTMQREHLCHVNFLHKLDKQFNCQPQQMPWNTT